MKYTVQYCLTQTTDGTPNFSKCESKCEGLFPALKPSWFASPRPAQYDYCTIQDNAFVAHADDCASCLQASSGSVVLGNFIDARKSGCDSRADAHSGQTIPIQRELFNTKTIAAPSNPTPSLSSTPTTSDISSASSTSATATSSVFSTGGNADSSSATSSPTSTAESAVGAGASSKGSTGLSSGAAAGIGVGCGLGALLLGAGVLWYIRRRRNTVRVPRSMFDLPPNHDTKNPLESRYKNLTPPPPAPRVESYGHERYEIGPGDSTKSITTSTSELDGTAVPRPW